MEINGIWRGLIENLPPQHQISLGKDFAFALSIFTTVLIIACPCALGLAIPLSTIAGVARAAEMGVLVKNIDALQASSEIDTLVFDKTGTLTTGEMTVTQFTALQGNENELLGLAKSLEQQASHPIAKAIVRFAEQAESLEISNINVVKGLGIAGEWNGQMVKMGNLAFLGFDERSISSLNLQVHNGSTQIYLSVNNQLAAIFTLADELRSESKAVIAKFQAEYHLAEPNLTVVSEATNSAEKAFTAKATQTALQFLTLLPNGVIRNSDTVKNVVETSLSIGVLSLQNEQLVCTILSRSLVEHGKEEVRSRFNALAQLTGATVEYSGNYPGWEPAPNSEITALTKKIYDEVLGYEAQIKVIHAGLECGLIKEVYPNMDLVSIGPTIRNAHSPDEKVHIPAVQIYWELLTKLLANAPQK